MWRRSSQKLHCEKSDWRELWVLCIVAWLCRTDPNDTLHLADYKHLHAVWSPARHHFPCTQTYLMYIWLFKEPFLGQQQHRWWRTKLVSDALRDYSLSADMKSHELMIILTQHFSAAGASYRRSKQTREFGTSVWVLIFCANWLQWTGDALRVYSSFMHIKSRTDQPYRQVQNVERWTAF